jgi:hypothetical protein
LDAQSISRTLSLLDQMMVRHASGESVSANVYAARHHFDELYECIQLKDGSAAIHPHVFALVMIHGLSNVGQYGQAKQCIMNAFDTYFNMPADNVMGSIVHQAHNLNEEGLLAHDSSAPSHPMNACLSDRKRQGGRAHGNRMANKRSDMSKYPTKCGACGDPNHDWSTYKAPDAKVLRWTLAKRKQIAEKHAGQSPPTTHLSEMFVDSIREEDDTCPPCHVRH